MAVTQQTLTAKLNNAIVVYHGAFRTQGTLTDDGTGNGQDAIVVTPVSGSSVTIPKATICGIS